MDGEIGAAQLAQVAPDTFIQVFHIGQSRIILGEYPRGAKSGTNPASFAPGLINLDRSFSLFAHEFMIPFVPVMLA